MHHDHTAELSTLRLFWDECVAGFLGAFRISARLFLGLLDVLGFIAIMFYQLLISPAAFRRYGRGLVASWRFSVKSYLYLENRIEYISMRFQHVLYYRGRLGLVLFDVADDERDGYLVLRKFGDEAMAVMNFRCTNRWAAKTERPSSFHLNDIMSQALNSGFYVAHLYWKDCLMKPYDVAALGIIEPVIDESDRRRLWPERHWVPEQKTTPVRLDPHKFQDIIHQA